MGKDFFQRKMKIVKTVISNPEFDLPLVLEHLPYFGLCEKEKGKWYVVSHCADGKEFVFFDEKNPDKKQVAKSQKEVVRQLFIRKLIIDYGYPRENVRIDEMVRIGRQRKKVDVVVYHDDKKEPWMLINVKSPYERLDVQAAKNYLKMNKSSLAVAVNGKAKTVLYSHSDMVFDNLPDLPTYEEYLKVKNTSNPVSKVVDIVLSRKWALDDLDKKNKITTRQFPAKKKGNRLSV